MRLHTRGSLLLTDLDDGLKNSDEAFNEFWVGLVLCDELETARIESLENLGAVVIEGLSQAQVAIDEEAD